MPWRSATVIDERGTYGLPDRIRTDNGQPFAIAATIGRVSQLSAWCVQIGIPVPTEMTSTHDPGELGASSSPAACATTATVSHRITTKTTL